MPNRYLFPILIIATLFSCDSKVITDRADYENYLQTSIDSTQLLASSRSWTERIYKSKNKSYVYLIQRANAYNDIFKMTADITYLKMAEDDLLSANTISNHNDAGLLRLIASNYISQHRFKEALEYLKIAEKNGEDKAATKKMLFDVHLELGNYIYAESYLDDISNKNDFDYLIRLAKWEDHNGNLEQAIAHMEKATELAEASNLKNIKKWAYTNLADFYGHSGQIKKSYSYYLKALKLDPMDAYAKKGIAWITYSHEKNAEEALDILNHVASYHSAPDYELLKAEIADFQNDLELKTNAIQRYRDMVNDKNYGEMYNSYNIILYTDDLSLSEDALIIAKKEVANRPTPETYDLLAWCHFKNGNIERSRDIIDQYVVDQTFEPVALYHIAEIYKASGDAKRLPDLKAELEESLYELGPMMKAKIEKL